MRDRILRFSRQVKRAGIDSTDWNRVALAGSDLHGSTAWKVSMALETLLGVKTSFESRGAVRQDPTCATGGEVIAVPIIGHDGATLVTILITAPIASAWIAAIAGERSWAARPAKALSKFELGILGALVDGVLAATGLVTAFGLRCGDARVVGGAHLEPGADDGETLQWLVTVSPARVGAPLDAWEVHTVHENRVRTYPLIAGAWNYLGRAAGCVVRLEETLEWVSQLHAAILVDREGPTLKDHRSRNGTFVNEVAVGESAALALKEGDRISLGPPHQAGNPVFVIRRSDLHTGPHALSSVPGWLALRPGAALSETLTFIPGDVRRAAVVAGPCRLLVRVAAEMRLAWAAVNDLSPGSTLVPDDTPLCLRGAEIEGAGTLVVAGARPLAVGSVTSGPGRLEFVLEHWLVDGGDRMTPDRDDREDQGVRQESRASQNPPAESIPVGVAHDVTVTLRIVLAEMDVTLAELTAVAPGTRIEFPFDASDAAAVMVGDRILARGRLVDVGDGRLGLEIEEIAK